MNPQDIKKCVDYIQSKVTLKAKHAIVLGTGLSQITNDVEIACALDYRDIPYFPQSTVQSHEGKLIFGHLRNVPVILLSGRFHYYEGYSMKEVTFPIRVLKQLGIQHLILSNAAGGINPHFKEGDIVLIQDHINMLPEHPLRGPNEASWGVRFPDMMHVYDKSINQKFLQSAKELAIELKKGVYLALQGPSLETPAEYKMAHILGADLVGMSTVPEAIVAKHAEIKVTAFSIVSNVCFPASQLSETTVEQVIEVVTKASDKLRIVLLHYFENV